MNSITTLVEARFDPQYHNKYATLMAAGNGALGVRATHEEAYTTQTRGMFFAGLYHRQARAKPQNWSICRIWWVWRLSLTATFLACSAAKY